MTRVPVAAGFHGFWPGFAGPDFLAFGARVRERFDVRVVEALEEAEVVVYSVFPDERPVPRHPHTSVFYTPECVPPDLDLFDFALSFHPLEHPRHLRLPNYVLRLRRNGLSPAALRRDGAVPAGAGSRRFCNFVHSNPVPFRERFCERLSGYRRVDAPGVSCNNMPPIGTGVADKLAFVSQYKFTLAFENESAVGYTTEKIVEPFLAGSVPIYWGNPEVARDFDPRSFINAHDFASEDELLEHIVRVDGDDDLYRSYLAASPYAGNVVPEVLRDETLDSFVERILSSGVRSTLDERFAGGFSFRPAGRRVRRLDVRSFATLAFAEEVVSAPELLAAYADAFSEADDASLVIYAPALDPGLAERLSAVADRPACSPPAAPTSSSCRAKRTAPTTPSSPPRWRRCSRSARRRASSRSCRAPGTARSSGSSRSPARAGSPTAAVKTRAPRRLHRPCRPGTPPASCSSRTTTSAPCSRSSRASPRRSTRRPRS